MERHEEVLDLYDQRVWGVAKDYSQDQINAISLLARLELAGVDVGNRWQDLGNYLHAKRVQDSLPFLDMQYLYGLARAQRAEADNAMRNIETHCASLTGPAADAWQGVCLPASRGLLAHARGDYKRAVDELGQACPAS